MVDFWLRLALALVSIAVVARPGVLLPLSVETLPLLLLMSETHLSSRKAGICVLKRTDSRVFFGIGRLASPRTVESRTVGTQPLRPCKTSTTEVTVKWHY